jgi:hypothetical protein
VAMPLRRDSDGWRHPRRPSAPCPARAITGVHSLDC